MNFFQRLVREEDGQTYLEYAVLLALIAIVVATSAGFVGNALALFMERISDSINTATVNNLM